MVVVMVVTVRRGKGGWLSEVVKGEIGEGPVAAVG
jgi:hypothetical protein